MAISFNKAFGVHEYALTLRAERSSVLANNIANADTPGYKARDIDFQSMLKAMTEQGGGNLTMQPTQKAHQNGLLQPDAINGLQYRNPTQPSIDGNTVDVQLERTEFARNSLEFKTAYTFLNGKIRGLMTAIRGE